MAAQNKPDETIQELISLTELLHEHTAAYERAKEVEQQARHNATEALNKLNDTQRELAAAVDELRKNAPAGSDWKAHEGREAAG